MVGFPPCRTLQEAHERGGSIARMNGLVLQTCADGRDALVHQGRVADAEESHRTIMMLLRTFPSILHLQLHFWGWGRSPLQDPRAVSTQLSCPERQTPTVLSHSASQALQLHARILFSYS